ncbi:hypothetical protein SAMD00019534_032360 [Acytostelium subglobosum LB1]|uniref:hypothetical protein n=1 Tax=Acytostelium subglobosum LB1 TaxID=1410327 RepID=UPI00064509F7|nr:hypothetical protein SAMD00019534_032360 [Acytostelium subglobosum LB1]GAM20061.1 hypothetical protein SAMD00019534_032360 [Acytostelium subglobosum LB1]|eukprot:XP_012756823.1 hypothetical protein SAMD00019534_032360 [Acytostelium subglobosum LB1]
MLALCFSLTLLVITLAVYNGDKCSRYLIVYYVLLGVQGARRLYETLCIQAHSYSTMSVLLFVSGAAYYFFASLSPLAEHAYRFNGDLQQCSGLMLSVPNALVKIIIFTLASYTQYQVHCILADIRNRSSSSTSKSSAGKVVYEIPQGGLFNFVSCPHFLSEIVIYLSLLSLSNFNSITLWLLIIFTSLNLIHRSLDTHRWYKQTFKSQYPHQRMAIIPFVL